MNLEFSRQNSEKYSDIKFLENPSSGSRVVTFGRTDEQTNKMKMIVGFCSFAKAHIKQPR